MKKYLFILAAIILALGLAPAYSQFGPTPGGPQFGGGMEKLFGDNQAFSATMQMQMSGSDSPMTMSGKISFDKGSSRTEMNMADMKGGNIPPEAMTQMKSMGLDRMVSISLADKKIVYLVYPNVQSYTELTPPSADAGSTNADPKIEITELGKETMDGHPCVKNKAVVTDKQGTKHEFTVWNATDLKKFPVKIAMTEQGGTISISYSDISFTKPDASLFNPPASFTKYGGMQEMMQAVMMKKMGGMGLPPTQH